MAFASTEGTDGITEMLQLLEAIQKMEKLGFASEALKMKTRVEEMLSRERERAKEQKV